MIGDKLLAAGITVVDGVPRGRVRDVDGIDVRWSNVDDDAKADLDGVVRNESAAFYVERSGRVWVLAEGPRGVQRQALVFMQGHDDTSTPEQNDSLKVLLAILGDVYGFDDSPETTTTTKTTKKAVAKKATASTDEESS